MVDALLTEFGLLAFVIIAQLGVIAVTWRVVSQPEWSEWEREWIDRYYDDGKHGPGND